MGTRLESIWYGESALGAILAPLGWIYAGAVALRRGWYRSGIARVDHPGVPVVVVGNISVGGTGKTPLVIWIACYLQEQGFRPGIVTRGYRGRAPRWPQRVRADSDPDSVGDEPVVLARGCDCPVIADPVRARAARMLVAENRCDVIISDDGLQHMGLGRDVEIAVIDGVRRHGNGRCLPAGPLREPISRLATVDLVVANGEPRSGEHAMGLVPLAARPVAAGGPERSLDAFAPGPVHAVCGIGHPRRFFALLEARGLDLVIHEFPDHHAYSAGEIAFGDGKAVLMTEKDAVKCRRFAGPEHWYVPVRAEPAAAFGPLLLGLLGQGAGEAPGRRES